MITNAEQARAILHDFPAYGPSRVFVRVMGEVERLSVAGISEIADLHDFLGWTNPAAVNALLAELTAAGFSTRTLRTQAATGPTRHPRIQVSWQY